MVHLLRLSDLLLFQRILVRHLISASTYSTTVQELYWRWKRRGAIQSLAILRAFRHLSRTYARIHTPTPTNVPGQHNNNTQQRHMHGAQQITNKTAQLSSNPHE